MIIRYKSRYSREARELLGGFIIDSSSKGAGGPTETFLENSDPTQTWNCRPAHYEVRPNMYRESQGKTFPMYIGDGRLTPQILTEERASTDKSLDPDRIIRCPIQILGDMKADKYRVLQDTCGINTGSSDLYFSGDISHLLACATTQNNIPETFFVEFYDKTDTIMSHVEHVISQIPKETFLSIGLDLAIASDTAGITISAFDHWIVRGKTKEPFYKVYACFGLTRKDGQETSLAHIYEFIIELSKLFQVSVSFDVAYSKALQQDCEREGIPCRYLSTDKTPELGTYLKSIIQYEQMEMPENNRLFREAYDLRIVPPRCKIDHPKKASLVFDNKDGSNPTGSKDLWDSLSQSLYNMHLYLSDGLENGVSTSYVKQQQLMDYMTTTAQDILMGPSGAYQDMLDDIF